MTENTAVLVAEDNVIVRMDTSQQFLDAGFIVFEASTAEMAIEVLEENPEIHLLFTDIDMPGRMDGLKLAATVRNRWPSIKIIVTSGHRSGVAEALPSAVRFLAKPYIVRNVALIFRSMLET